MSPDDATTAEEARVVHPSYAARLARLEELRAAMAPAPFRVDRDMALQIKREIDIIEQGG